MGHVYKHLRYERVIKYGDATHQPWYLFARDIFQRYQQPIQKGWPGYADDGDVEVEATPQARDRLDPRRSSRLSRPADAPTKVATDAADAENAVVYEGDNDQEEGEIDDSESSAEGSFSHDAMQLDGAEDSTTKGEDNKEASNDVSNSQSLYLRGGVRCSDSEESQETLDEYPSCVGSDDETDILSPQPRRKLTFAEQVVGFYLDDQPDTATVIPTHWGEEGLTYPTPTRNRKRTLSSDDAEEQHVQKKRTVRGLGINDEFEDEPDEEMDEGWQENDDGGDASDEPGSKDEETTYLKTTPTSRAMLGSTKRYTMYKEPIKPIIEVTSPTPRRKLTRKRRAQQSLIDISSDSELVIRKKPRQDSASGVTDERGEKHVDVAHAKQVAQLLNVRAANTPWPKAPTPSPLTPAFYEQGYTIHDGLFKGVVPTANLATRAESPNQNAAGHEGQIVSYTSIFDPAIHMTSVESKLGRKDLIGRSPAKRPHLQKGGAAEDLQRKHRKAVKCRKTMFVGRDGRGVVDDKKKTSSGLFVSPEGKISPKKNISPQRGGRRIMSNGELVYAVREATPTEASVDQRPPPHVQEPPLAPVVEPTKPKIMRKLTLAQYTASRN